jgi:hypothetical protein
MQNDSVSDEELAKREQELLGAVERLGGRAGNTTLRRELDWEEAVYWQIRDRLVDRGRLVLGRGKGGSVRLVPSVPEREGPEGGPAVPPAVGPDAEDRPAYTVESDLYSPIAEVLRTAWARDKRYRDQVVEVTAQQGKRETGGKWTRPDLTVASITTLLYVPGKLFDVTTFEVKPANVWDVTVVYEALAHRRAATRSYVWLHVPEKDLGSDGVEERLAVVVAEAKQHDIGVIVGSDPRDYDTWDERVEAGRVDPDPQKLNDFIAVQFTAGNKDELLKWMR